MFFFQCKKSQGGDALGLNNPMDFSKEKIHKEMKPDVENPTECGQCLTPANDDENKTLRRVVIEKRGLVYYNCLFLSPKPSASNTVTSYSQTEFSEGSTPNSKSFDDCASDTEDKEYLKDTKQALDVEPQADVQQLPKPLKLMKDFLRDRTRMFLKSKVIKVSLTRIISKHYIFFFTEIQSRH